MRWRGRRTSSRVEDRRGRGGLRGGMVRGRGMRIGGVGAIVVVLVGLFLGVDPAMLMNIVGGVGGTAPVETVEPGPNSIDDQTEEFVAVVLADTEAVWETVFEEMGRDYERPSLVLFSGAVRSACGTASSAVGPFYCPGDGKAYLDTSFFGTLAQRYGAAGDFAAAYVIGHEVAHHVQNQLGISEDVSRMRAGASETESNALSVRLELQADCLSGVWASRADARFDILEPGDIDEALTAAAAIGDDTLQRRSSGVVVPDSFTHGSAEQRTRWFRRGFEAGAPGACDTFAAGAP